MHFWKIERDKGEIESRERSPKSGGLENSLVEIQDESTRISENFKRVNRLALSLWLFSRVLLPQNPPLLHSQSQNFTGFIHQKPSPQVVDLFFSGINLSKQFP